MASERDFFEALKRKYDAKEWALIPQVRNATGFQSRTRTADAIAVSLWPSRGIDAHGFEFKDSRSDWKKELDQPEKAEEIGRYCAYWWVVVSDVKIVKNEELPAAWGLMTLDEEGEKVRVVKQAPRRGAESPGWKFCAAVLRAAAEATIPEAEITKRIDKAVAKAKDEAAEQARRVRDDAVKREKEMAGREYQKLLDVVSAFEKSSGIELHAWMGPRNAEKLGEATKFVLSGGLAQAKADIARLVEQCDKIRAVASAAVEAA